MDLHGIMKNDDENSKNRHILILNISILYRKCCIKIRSNTELYVVIPFLFIITGEVK